MRSGKRIIVLLAIVAWVVVAQTAFACPNCKDSLVEGDPTYSGVVQGFFWSIMIMLATPLFILVGLGSYFYLLVRRANAERANNPDLAGSPFAQGQVG